MTSKQTVCILPVLGLIIIAISCTDLHLNPAASQIQTVIDSPSFKNDIMPVLKYTCGSSGACHGGATPQLGLNLEVDSLAYAATVNVIAQRENMARILPFKPDSSFLFLVLSDTASVRLNYYRMPLTRYSLPQETRLTIKNWILKGALNN
ncbi:MAG TPA: hypothetical protein VGI92_07895 [Gemmatimonadales bacterium]|jgi:hypothetical protein